MENILNGKFPNILKNGKLCGRNVVMKESFLKFGGWGLIYRERRVCSSAFSLFLLTSEFCRSSFLFCPLPTPFSPTPLRIPLPWWIFQESEKAQTGVKANCFFEMPKNKLVTTKIMIIICHTYVKSKWKETYFSKIILFRIFIQILCKIPIGMYLLHYIVC